MKTWDKNLAWAFTWSIGVYTTIAKGYDAATTNKHLVLQFYSSTNLSKQMHNNILILAIFLKISASLKITINLQTEKVHPRW